MLQVGALIKNVTHGLSNSAAKVTGSLGDGLTRTFTMDVRHEDERRKIREEYSGSSSEQFAGGLRGFGHGVFGGLTSIITQTYDGVVNDGFTVSSFSTLENIVMNFIRRACY